MGKEKKEKVLDAALKAFTRYGFRRVTMGDIAEEAGMSRPALYLVFPSKEEIFKAAVTGIIERAIEETRAGLADHDSTAEKLTFVFDVWTVRPFKLIHEAPNAKELTDFSFGFAREVMEDGYREFEKLLVSIIEPHTDALSRHDLTPCQLAHVLALTVRGFKEGALDVDELLALIAGLVRMTMAALDL
jgi:AcrR family transcriptional regulator